MLKQHLDWTDAPVSYKTHLIYIKIPVHGWDFFLFSIIWCEKEQLRFVPFSFSLPFYISPLNSSLVYAMENTNSSSSSSTSKVPTLCTAGCGFYGSEAFNNMCSQCFKAQHKSDNNSTAGATTATTTATTEKIKTLPQITRAKISSPPKSTPSTPTFNDNSVPIAAEKSRKHLRSPSPNGPRISSAPASSIASPVPTSTSSTTDKNVTASAESSTTNPSDKPVQLNKGRCFKCRSKV